MSYTISRRRMRSFLDRFVHPRLAAIVLTGIVLWGFSFLIAATGLTVRGSNPLLSAQLFFISGVIGVFGMGVIAVCCLWLGCLRVIQIVYSRRMH